MLQFTTNYNEILQQVEAINPIKYASTRNYINGAVTYLSPYISRGVISTKQVLETMLNKGFELNQIQKFVQELAWRDYYQLVWQAKGNDINNDIKNVQVKVSYHGISKNIVAATTGINGIDDAVKQLYETGYMHNHCRMYTAAVTCNIAQAHWHNPAQWMYYYLLDGDWASNALSWQWVAGSFSSKKYYANQENINKYTFTNQQQTFLDVEYRIFNDMNIPNVLLETEVFKGITTLPAKQVLNIDENSTTYIYNYYNLDPAWHSIETANRILLLEPSIFQQYPISNKCVAFMLALAKKIHNIQIFIGSFNDLIREYSLKNIVYKEHPLNQHYTGICEPRDWLCNTITGYYPSFFNYWRKLEKQLK